MKPFDYAPYYAFLRDGLARFVNGDVGRAERSAVALELTLVSNVVRTMMEMDDRTCDLTGPGWFMVDTQSDPLHPWEQHSEHSHRDCAEEVCRDMIRERCCGACRVTTWPAGEVLETFVASYKDE